MRDDTTRKIYRILCNKWRSVEFKIDAALIARLSLRTEQQVKDSVNWLVKEGYLKWDRLTNTFKIPFK